MVRRGRHDESNRDHRKHHSGQMDALARIAQRLVKALIPQAKLIGPNAPQEKKDQLADFEKKFAQMIDAQVGWDVMEPALTDYYQSAFTEEELDVILTFYKTPAGAALIEKMPAVNAQATQLLQTKMAAVQPQMKQMYEEFQKSQSATAPATSPAAPSTPPASASK